MTFLMRPHRLSVAGPSAPGAPSIISTTPGNAQATVNWSAPSSDGGSAVTGYSVDIYKDSDDSLVNTITVGLVNTHTFTGLVNGTAYYFAVGAINAAGTGPDAFSGIVTPTPGAAVPSAPQNVTLTNNGGSTLEADWTAPASPNGTIIRYDYYLEGPANGTQSGGSTPNGSTLFASMSPPPGDDYTFYVCAVNATGAGPFASAGPVTF